MKSRLSYLLSLLVALALALGACAPATAARSNPNLILATTTSTQDSGLLDVLIPLFEAESGYTVQTVAVGSGQAMKMGEEGNADVLLVHAPASEVTFMEKGFGKDRALVMHNDFIIIGPAADPVGVKGMAVEYALKALSAGNATLFLAAMPLARIKSSLPCGRKQSLILKPPRRAGILNQDRAWVQP